MPPRRISLSEGYRRNIVYSEAERTVIKNALKTTEAGLLRLGTLQSDGAARCQITLAPYKKIPKEIWMYIFELCCQFCRPSTCDTWQPPAMLTRVCSEWRQTVLSMPELWSDVRLGKNVKLARVWLGRAGNIPRALEISRRFHQPLIICNFICSFPLRKLHLSECDAASIDFTTIPVESLLLLEDLRLFKAPHSLGVASFFPHHLPNLVSLNIGMKSMPRFHESHPFATWKKLRVLRLNCELKGAEYLEILRDASSSVEDCSLCLSPESDYAQSSTIEVATLKTLRLVFSLTPQLWSFLDHLTFPTLHTLILTCPRSINFVRSDRSSLPLRFAPHIGSLISLNIHRHYRSVDVGLMLGCLPLLQVLELYCKEVTRHTAEKIGRGELGGCLRELRDWSPHNLYEFLHACELRRDVTRGQSPNGSGAIAGLEKVSVRHTKEVLYWQRIGKLHKDGVEFIVVQDEC